MSQAVSRQNFKMKKLIICILLLTAVAGCKKSGSSAQRRLPNGTKFNVVGISLKSLQKNGIEPTNPFTVDSLFVQNSVDMNFYYCHSANGLLYQIPDDDCAPL
jgi:hypothetical protein